MKKKAVFRTIIVSFVLLFVLFFLVSCEVAVTGSGKGTIDFQPGVKDWNWKDINIVNDDNLLFIGGFGPTIWQGATQDQVKDYKFHLFSSWIDIRNANPEEDFMALDNIWEGYNGKFTNADGSIGSVVFAWCVLTYNTSEINSVPGTILGKHIHRCRISVISKMVNGKNIETLKITVYNNSNDPNDDTQQLNVTLTDTNTVEAVAITRF
jgi:hypothetical protein